MLIGQMLTLIHSLDYVNSPIYGITLLPLLIGSITNFLVQKNQELKKERKVTREKNL